MTDDLGQELRERLGRAPLPAAPSRLRDEIENLRAMPAPTAARARFGRGRGMTLLAAAAALVLVGGALVVGSGVVRPTPVVPPQVTAPSVNRVASAASDATSPSPSDSPSPSPSAQSLALTWTTVPLTEHTPRVAWVGDRFVLADLDSGAVRTSTDGTDWQAVPPGDAAAAYVTLLSGSVATWQDQTVAWLNPENGPPGGGDVAGYVPSDPRHIVTIVQPPAAPIQTVPFKGPIESIGIGPKGMVAETHSALDFEHWVTKRLGLRTNNDWTMHVKSFTFRNGVLKITLHNRPGLEVNWADQGFEPGDIEDSGFAWYSPDGAQWTELAPRDQVEGTGSTLPTGVFGQVVGVSDGFITSGACTPDGCDLQNMSGIWYSADGLSWRLIANVSGGGDLRPWLGGALTGNFDLWTSGGSTTLPIAADLADRAGPSAIGPLGLVGLTNDNRNAFVSRDGIQSGTSPIPPDMSAGNHSRGGPTIAVGDQTVLVLETVHDDLHPNTHSLWLGTFQP